MLRMTGFVVRRKHPAQAERTPRDRPPPGAGVTWANHGYNDAAFAVSRGAFFVC
jgi:CubicO group peptidase (beta-lactamase class C family)